MVSSTKNDRQLFVQACKKFISSRGSVTTLGVELGSEHVARDALRSLLAGFPDDWDAALARSYSSAATAQLAVRAALQSLVDGYLPADFCGTAALAGAGQATP